MSSENQSVCREKADEAPLALWECRDFVSFYATALGSPAGCVKSLRAFAQANNTRVARAVGCLYEGLGCGLSFRAALERCEPRFPRALETLIDLGDSQSRLDLALADLLKILESEPDETGLQEKAKRLLAEYRKSAPVAICAACLRDEIAALFDRARAEKADEVIVGWREGLMTQVFLGVKAVCVSVPASRLVVDTIKNFCQKTPSGLDPSQIFPELKATFPPHAEVAVQLQLGASTLTVRFQR